MILLLPIVTEGYIEKQNCYVLIYMYFADIVRPILFLVKKVWYSDYDFI